MGGNNSSETTQDSVLVKRFMEIRQDGISMVLNAERGLAALNRPVPTAIIPKPERRKRRRKRPP